MCPQAADGEGARGSRARRSCAPTPSRLETYDGRVEQLELTKGLELEMKSLAEQLGWEKEDLEEKLEEKKAELARVTDTRPGRHAETQVAEKFRKLKVDTGLRSKYTSRCRRRGAHGRD